MWMTNYYRKMTLDTLIVISSRILRKKEATIKLNTNTRIENILLVKIEQENINICT